jgi:hypothetical protein
MLEQQWLPLEAESQRLHDSRDDAMELDDMYSWCT